MMLLTTLASAIAIWRDEDWAPEPWQTILTFFLCVLIATLINLFGAKFQYLERLNTMSMIWGAASVVIILVTLLVLAPQRRNARFVFGGFENSGGWPDGWGERASERSARQTSCMLINLFLDRQPSSSGCSKQPTH